MLWKCGNVQTFWKHDNIKIFGNSSDKSKVFAKKWLLLFSQESFVFSTVIQTYKNEIYWVWFFLLFYTGWKWSATLVTVGEEHIMRLLENMLPRKNIGPNMEEVAGTGGNCTIQSFMMCCSHQILFGWQNQEECSGCGMRHLWGRGEVHTWFWWGNLSQTYPPI